MFKKILRYAYRLWLKLGSKIRKLKFRLLYRQISFDNKTMLERGCRIICVNGGAISIRNSHVSFNTVIHAGKDAEIRINDSFISHNCTIVAKSKIIIGSNCLIAELVTIRDQNHLFSDRTKLIQDQGFSSKPIIIEENVWLGCKATILAGTTIGRNSIIGAHALVKGAVEENSLYAGIPAIKKKSF